MHPTHASCQMPRINPRLRRNPRLTHCALCYHELALPFLTCIHHAGVANELAPRHIPEVTPRNDTLAGPMGRRADQVRVNTTHSRCQHFNIFSCFALACNLGAQEQYGPATTVGKIALSWQPNSRPVLWCAPCRKARQAYSCVVPC